MPARDDRDGAGIAWLIAGAIVVAAWAAGYLLWRPSDGEGFRAAFAVGEAVDAVVVGAPASAVAGLLIASRRRRLQALGAAVLLLAACAVGYIVSWVFFGICIDPGEVCRTTSSAQLLTLVAGVASVAVGYVVLRVRLFTRTKGWPGGRRPAA